MIRLTASLETPKGRRPKSILIHLRLKNESAADVVFHDFHDANLNGMYNFDISLTNAKGEPVAIVRPVIAAKSAHGYTTLHLAEGDEWKGPIDLTDWDEQKHYYQRQPDGTITPIAHAVPWENGVFTLTVTWDPTYLGPHRPTPAVISNAITLSL